MTRISLSVCAGLLALAMASPSSAADLPRPSYKAPIYAPPIFTWTGAYIGINGGYAWGDADISNTAATFTTGTNDGWLIGGTLGYNLQTGRYVWGIEGDIDYAFIKGNGSNVATCGTGTCEVKNTWFATARGRLGYSFDRWLPYITGGAAFAGVKVTPTAGTSSTDTATGWTIGGGLEYAFLGPWSAKLEYLYADLGTATCGASICGLETDIKPKLNIVRAGLNYRF